jgi:hypothetical protein
METQHKAALQIRNPYGSALILVGWIRIQEDKNDPQKREKV